MTAPRYARIFLLTPKAAEEPQILAWAEIVLRIAKEERLDVLVYTARDYWHSRFPVVGSINAWKREVIDRRFDLYLVPSDDGRCGVMTGELIGMAQAAGLRVAWLRAGLITPLAGVLRQKGRKMFECFDLVQKEG